MSKLQLYISKSFKGYKVLFNVNPSEEVTASIHELRQTVEKVTYDASEKNIFFLMSTTETGTFFTIIRTIPTETVDHLAAWIYIPGDLVIEPAELKRIVTKTARKVSGERVTAEDTAELRELFATDYPIDPEAPAMIPSNRRGQLAWRRYNGETGLSLEDLFTKGLYQLYYLDYSGVMIVDGDLGIEVDGVDLTETPLGEKAVLLAPEKTSQGFMAHLYGKPFDKPFLGSLGANLPLVWKRQGFEDVEDAQVVNETPFTPSTVETTGSRKAISIATFQITGQNTNLPVDDCQILVNGVEVSAEPHLFTQAELAQASVVINHTGYYPYTAHLDLASTTRALVKLKERMKVYKFEIPTKSSDLGSPVEFTILSKKPLTESPIEGYSLLDDIQEGESRLNHLGHSGGSTSWVQKLIFFAIGLGLGLIASIGLSKCSGGSSSSTSKDSIVTDTNIVATTDGETANGDQTADSKQTVVDAPNVPAGPKAIEYLEQNDKWTKAGLENFPELAGLYDDLNNYRTDRVLNTWGPKLAKSNRFTNLVNHMRDGRNKPKAKALQGKTFNPDNKTEITVKLYLYKVNP